MDGTRRVTTAMSVSLAVGGTGLVTAVWFLVQREPTDVLNLVILGGLLVLTLLGFITFAIVARHPRVVVAPFVGVLALVGAGATAEPLHWTLSEDAFVEALDGVPAESCTDREPCRIGWWDIEGVDSDPDLPTVWVHRGACYAGHGLARPPAGMALEYVRRVAEERDGGRGYLDVYEWYGDWVVLCFTT